MTDTTDPLAGIELTLHRPCPPEDRERMLREFRTYLRELPRLLAEGHEGHYALISGDVVVSVWETQREVLQAGHERFGLAPFTVKRIDSRDPQRLEAIRAKQEGGACPC